MTPCQRNQLEIDLYLDGELVDESLEMFLLHTKDCVPCQQQFAQQATLQAVVRRSKPLYQPSYSLRQKIAAMLAAE
jgi:anti-sigma factor RsiW